MAALSRPIPLPLPLPEPLPLPFPYPSASAPAATPLPMNYLSRLRLATGYTRFATSSASSCNRLSKVTVSSAARVRVSSTESMFKESWLAALSCPLTRKEKLDLHSDSDSVSGSGEVITGSEWIIGVDPDVSGALALLRPDQSPCGFSAEVFDAPQVKVMVGKRVRNRLDPRSIVQLLHSFNAPMGTRVYIEQSRPFPQDGKQGWWSGGFTYGMWLGLLVASGFSVKPISSLSWKNFFELSGASSSKDGSRKAALDMFPSLASLLKRKKDHGRAEALLIAAYGRNLTLESNLNSTLIESKELQLQSC